MKHRQKHIKNKLRRLAPKKNFLKSWWFWIGILGILFVAGVFYIIFFLPAIQIKAVQIFGNEHIKKDSIEQAAWKHINQKLFETIPHTMLTFSSVKLENGIMHDFPGIERAIVQKKWPDTIVVTIQERKPFAVFCAGQDNQECFLLDRYGVIYQTSEAQDEPHFIVRQNIGFADLVMGRLFVDANIMDALIKVKNALETGFNINLKEAFISNPLVFTTAETWKIYLDPSQNIDAQIAKMDVLLKNNIGPEERRTMQYLYLQYSDRAYYK